MALRDYAEIDEEDFYGQGFREEGLVSVWAGTEDLSGAPPELDVLQDYCGVGYYDVDSNEVNHHGYVPTPVRTLLGELSFSASFADAASTAAERLNLGNPKWVICQYDFRYDASRVKRPTNQRALFIGAFPYSQAHGRLVDKG